MRRLLGLSAYRRLLAAYALNELAWGLGALTVSFLVYRRTGSAVGAAAFYLSALFVPALVAPMCVARIDHLAPRLILPLLYAGEGLAFLAMGVVALHFSLPVILVLAFLDGTAALTARPLARATTVAVTAPAGLLREGNAANNLCFSIAFMLGPALGGAVVAAGGTSTSLFINAGVFTAMAVMLATAGMLPGPRPPSPAARGGRVRAALRHARERPMISRLLGLQAVAVLFFTLSIPVEVVYAQHTLRAGPGGYGALLTAWGAGAVLGSAVYARWNHFPSRFLIMAGAGLMGLGLAGMAASPSLVPALVAAALAGIGNGIEAIAARTAIQEEAHADWMALIMSFSESINEVAPGVGIILGGAIAATSGSRTALAVGGVGSLLVSVAAWGVLNPRREFRRVAAQRPPL